MGLRYGQGKYGMGRYGVSDAGFQFKVQISNSAGTVQALLNNQVVSLRWTYKKTGGCDKFELVLKRASDNLDNLTNEYRRELYDVQIYVVPRFGGSTTLYYRGYITSIRPNLEDREEIIISGTGYGDRLNKIIISDGTGAPKEYTSTTVSGVVSSLITDFVAPNTPITAGTIDTFSTVIASIKFNGSVYEALKKLADVVGAEFGVDRNREIYFRTPSTTVGYRFRKAYDCNRIEDELDYSDLVNKVYVEGGRIDGVPYRFVKTDEASKNNYGLFETRISNSSVVDETLARVLADSILNVKREYRRNMRIYLPFNLELLESSNPLSLIAFVDDPKIRTQKYGSQKYGAGKYCGENLYKMSRIDYELKDVSLLTEVELNDGKPDVDNKFDLLNFELEQQRQSEGV